MLMASTAIRALFQHFFPCSFSFNPVYFEMGEKEKSSAIPKQLN